MFSALSNGITGRALEKGLISLKQWNPRDFTADNYQTVDDRPYGGGPGMVMLAQPLCKAIAAGKKALGPTKVVYLSPQGELFNHQRAEALKEQPSLLFVAGRYEGIDERVMREVDIELSIGDYVLSGGELGAMVVIDAITRLLPGALGDPNSALEDSFCHGLLDHPHYTRPEEFAGQRVPEVLLSGNHGEIARWRQYQALKRTWQRRPELLEGLELTKEQQRLLQQLQASEQVDSTDQERTP